MNQATEKAIAQAADIWKSAACTMAVTGAGISVPSGIPDFRSPGGLWTLYDPSEVATLTALKSNPRRVWEFLVEAHHVFTDAKPNPAHETLARIESQGLLAGIVTQNIDGLHQRAGSANVIEFHGNGARYYCQSCRKNHPPEAVPNLTAAQLPWTCECGGVIRPDFVFFGEMIPPKAMDASRALTSRADLCVIIGTSGEVAPANTLPVMVAHSGGKVIEINLGPTTFGQLADVRIDAPCEEVLPALAHLLGA